MAKNKIYIPTFISSVNYAPARVLPHIYFYNGLKVSETWYLQGYQNGNTGSVTSHPLESFPYVDNYEGQDPTSGSKSLLFFNEPAVYGTTPTGSLYTEYWDKYISLLYNPRTRLFNCEGIIPLADYFQMELNDIVEWRGNYYHLRAINDYNLSNGECKLQLLGPILGDILPGIIPAIRCDFNFTSSFILTTTTTAGPTTTSTTSTSTTSTTTTSTSTTSTTSTTTTLAPTTTTTTLAPTTSCDCVLFVAGGAGGEATYIECGGGPVTKSLAGNETYVACFVSGTAALTGPSSVISYGYNIASNPDCASTSSVGCMPSASCNCATFVQGIFDAGTYWYTSCETGKVIAGTLNKEQSLKVCLVSGSWAGITGEGSTITYYTSSCSTNTNCGGTPPPTTTTTSTTSTTTTTTTAAPTTTTTTSTTTTTTAAPTTTTTTTNPYDYYLADEYDCDTCTLQNTGVLVGFATGTSVTTNKFYKRFDSQPYVYQIVTATDPGSPAVLLVTPQYNTCGQACGATTTTTTSTTTTSTTTTTAAPRELHWTFTVMGGATGQMKIWINGTDVETRSTNSNGVWSLSVGDTIYFELNASGCTGGNNKANTYTLVPGVPSYAILGDATCANNSSSLTTGTYTVQSSDGIIYVDAFSRCDGGCV